MVPPSRNVVQLHDCAHPTGILCNAKANSLAGDADESMLPKTLPAALEPFA